MYIRKASTKDFKKIREIKTEFFVSKSRMDSLLNPSWVKKGLGRELKKQLKSKNCVVYVAEDKNNIVGFAVVEIEKTLKLFIPTIRGNIHELYVKKAYRNQGLGQKLADMTLRWLKQKNIKWVKVYVNTKNQNSHKFYKRFGFRDYTLELEKTIR